MCVCNPCFKMRLHCTYIYLRYVIPSSVGLCGILALWILSLRSADLRVCESR